ncbi:hypothetical protein FACS1894199_03510 [Bacteroidia bacterium]|nr:hypothetical protein FACS1894199_03510 [Bacteroidia bacterium]
MLHLCYTYVTLMCKIQFYILVAALVAAFICNIATIPDLRAQSVSPDGNGVVFVTPSGTSSGNSWVNACSLSIALDSARYKKEIKQIWVAAGTYKPNYPANVTSTNPRDKSFLLVDSVKMYGGGIYLTKSSPILTNLIINENTAKNGGAIYSFDSNPTLINSVITNNTANTGSALYVVQAPPIPTIAMMYSEDGGATKQQTDIMAITYSGTGTDNIIYVWNCKSDGTRGTLSAQVPVGTQASP